MGVSGQTTHETAQQISADDDVDLSMNAAMKLRNKKSLSEEIEKPKCDRINQRFRNVEVVLHKLNINRVCPNGTLKLQQCLSKKPVVKLKRVKLPRRLLSELQRRSAQRGVIVVKKVGDHETEQISDLKLRKGTEESAEVKQKPGKRKLKDPGVKQCQGDGPTPGERRKVTRYSDHPVINVRTDTEITLIRESNRKKSSKRIVRIDKATRYLKPSKTENDYGLGGKAEIDRDDVDNPIKQIPEWAEEKNYLLQMSSQAEVDPGEIFAPCGPPVLEEMFSSSRRLPWDTPPGKSNNIHPEEIIVPAKPSVCFSKNLLNSFGSIKDDS